MKAAFNILVVLAAVFFSSSSHAGTQTLAPSYYASYSSAQAAGDAYNSGGYVGGATPVTVGAITYGGLVYLKLCNSNQDYCYKTFYYPDGQGCVLPTVVVENTGECQVPPPVGDCAKEKGKRTQLSGPGTCVKVHQGLNCSGGACTNAYANCTVELVISVTPTAGAGSYDYMFTGASCTTQSNTAEPQPPDTSTGEAKHPAKNCITSGGSEYCTSSEQKPNCGTVNGNAVCVDSPPPGNCTFIGGASSWVCDIAAPTPPKPPGSPNVTIAGRMSNGQQGSVLVYPPGAEGGNSGSTYNGGQGSGTDKGFACGGEGQPKCKIDETGTPEWGEGEGGDPTSILDDGQGVIDATPGAASEADSSSLRSTISGALPSGGDCAPIVLTVAGHTTTLDGATKFAAIRQGLAWAFGLVAAYGVLMVWLRKS